MSSPTKEAEKIAVAAMKIVGTLAAIAIPIRLLGGRIGDFVAVLATVLVLVGGLKTIQHLA
ncbi:hypothetical protein ACT4ML_19690 [Natrinema sp. LN54]|uniref:hypothetical protein n=1 Tax=Natrinema sp. LN54 TaxID=3458705 RepID=UPI0040356E40